jgi:hypothetical protein
MKATKITYWITTSIITLMMLYTAYAYFTQPVIEQAFHHLGYPDYFRVELAIAKIIGAILLIAPAGPRVKEWTYAGFIITFVSAIIAHTVSGDPISHSITVLVIIALLVTSYITYHKKAQNPVLNS